MALNFDLRGGPAFSPVALLLHLVRFLATQFARWRRMKRDIDELRRLDDRMPRDIGITRSEVERLVRYGRWDDEVDRLERAFTSWRGRTLRSKDPEGKKHEHH